MTSLNVEESKNDNKIQKYHHLSNAKKGAALLALLAVTSFFQLVLLPTSEDGCNAVEIT